MPVGIAIPWLVAVVAGWFAVRSVIRARNVGPEVRLDGLGRARMLPGWIRRPLLRRCELAAYPGTPERWLVRTGAIALAAVALGSAASPTLAVLAGCAALTACVVQLVRQGRRAPDRAARSLCALLEAVAADLRGGETVVHALCGVQADDRLVAEGVADLVGRIELGATLPQALRVWPERCTVEGTRAVAAAITIANERGGPLAPALEHLAATLRDRVAARAEILTQSTQMRLSALVVAAAPIGYLAFTLAVDPRSSALLVTTGAGRLCLGVGLALDALAWWWINRIVGATP